MGSRCLSLKYLGCRIPANVTFSCAITSSSGADPVLSYSSIKDINYSIYRLKCWIPIVTKCKVGVMSTFICNHTIMQSYNWIMTHGYTGLWIHSYNNIISLWRMHMRYPQIAQLIVPTSSTRRHTCICASIHWNNHFHCRSQTGYQSQDNVRMLDI